MRTSALRRQAARRLSLSAGAALCATLLAACGAANAGDENSPDRTTNTPTNSPDSTQLEQPSRQQSGQVSREQAGDIVTDRYGGRVLDVESDSSAGEPTWEVEVADSEQGRIEVDVARSSGNIVEFEHD